MIKIRHLALIFIFLCSLGRNSLLLSQKKNIEISYTRNEDKSIVISYTKRLPGSYYLRLEFPKLENCFPTNYEGTVKDKAGDLVVLHPINTQEHVQFSYRTFSLRGVPNPDINHNIKYCIPFKQGTTARIGETTYLGESIWGSERPSKWKSYIAFTKSAETVCCMRKGIVVSIVNKFDVDTIAKHYTNRRNSILVEHPDGTYASYKGLKKNSMYVKLGQIVYPQTELGLVENFPPKGHRLDFCVFYVKSFERTENEETLQNRKSRNEYLTPSFYYNGESKPITPKKKYTVDFNEEILLQEFSKREKRKYKKHKKQ